MSYTTKTKGFRTITVNGTRYRWRLRTGWNDSTVTLQGTESGSQQALTVLRGVRDPWLAFSDGNTRSLSVTPGTVRRMIEQALAGGWEPGRRKAPLMFDFETHAGGLPEHQN